MTTISASITRTDGLPMEGRVEVSSAYYRAGMSAVITSDPVVVEMTGGSFRVDVEPGPTRVRIIAPHSQHLFQVNVPDGVDADFLRLVEEETVWEPAVVDRTRKLAEQAAKVKSEQAVAQVVDNATWDIGEERFGNKYVKTSREGYIFVYGEPDNSRALVPKSYVDKKANLAHTHVSADITDTVDAEASSQSATYAKRIVRLDGSGNLCAKTPKTRGSVATKGYVDDQLKGLSVQDSGWYDITSLRDSSGAMGNAYIRRVGDLVTLCLKGYEHPYSASKVVLFRQAALSGFFPMADYMGVFPVKSSSRNERDSVQWYFNREANRWNLTVWEMPKLPLTGSITWAAEPGWPVGNTSFAGTHIGNALP
ncbi:hypothetical protein H7347_07200 [Corynebacterium sp. zg-331]|uniref:hypothetical protein n=1 Tax=unclassified Corynebacterium TaxID=2624378 RepID=UPI00128B877A|nr:MULTISPECIES: hypothetical protein [unclassified Corynebacterium]MBC3186359.1 hypothetical protein [Corynebacterium sp. zg-331]MPV52846.1 hypothetical protein [Corynebacterium sp. zg331]